MCKNCAADKKARVNYTADMTRGVHSYNDYKTRVAVRHPALAKHWEGKTDKAVLQSLGARE